MTGNFARNGDLSIFYEIFGNRLQPTLVLINGFSEQCNSYLDEFCQLFVEAGFHMIRFDNRDVGLSIGGPESYSLKEMAMLPVGVGRQYKASRADRSRSDRLRVF